jgi:phosphatidylglycerol:prolipoprotein diacylglycerol transferase
MNPYYIHNINPILFHVGGPLAIRWYGISYLLGFIASILLLGHWAKRKEFSVEPEEVSNFVFGLAFFGVFLGGRLGYVLLYGLHFLKEDPLYLFKVWDGGMASHGGMVGVILYILWYARKHQKPFWNLTDNMACTASLGIAFGRIANFINGELWGRITTVPWAVIFPEKLGYSYGEYTPEEIRPLVEAGLLHPRHPSQLYQAFCEGFLVFALLLFLRKTPWGKRPGALSSAFLVLYAIARISMEFFREPDEGAPIYFGWLTKGQLYSLFMLLGAALIAWKKQLFASNTNA